MSKKKKKKLLNIGMVLLMIGIAAGGMLIVGRIQGWFDRTEDAIVTSGLIKGVANMERNGIGYTLDQDQVLRSGDRIETKKGTQAEFLLQDSGKFVLHENTEAVLSECSSETIVLQIEQGEVSGDTAGQKRTLEVIFAENKADLSNAVFSVNVQEETYVVNNYAGDVSVTLRDGSQEQVKEGESLSIINKTDGSISAKTDKLQQEADSADADRQESEMQRKENDSEASDDSLCTITIRCDTILDNMDRLDAGKEVYVPEDGTILDVSSVKFEEGETVFDVLTRVCEDAGIQIEYAWTAVYDSYYIEGINHLYEFDCGNESGWMYKVNGWFPNYGCSSYELEDGDEIVWCYTCNGLGEDVGKSEG